MYERILAAIDATPNENAVLNHTTELARLTGAKVHLLHVALEHVMPVDVLGGSFAGQASGDDNIDPRERELVGEAVAQLDSAGIHAEGEVLSGTEHDIADVIVDRARELNASLIVLGDTLHRGASKLFRASVADQVVHRHPPCPILLVH